ncbi:MAG: hypothetical protein JWO62_604 [Acidimicrobiaceae bacterium]|nr:hypothetical protein [Acidimicrobiaceae bacterium]
MASATFERSIVAHHPPQSVWETLTDVALVASWVPIVEEFQEIERLSHYSAVLRDQVGPFRLRADLDVRLPEVLSLERVRLTASGEDRQVGSRISVDVTLAIEEREPGSTTITVVGSYEVTGRIATLGTGTIRRKADKLIEQFFASAEKVLVS